MSSAPAATSTSAGFPLDFSDRWPAMVVKELRQGLRARWFVVPFMLLHVAVLAAVALEYMILRDASSPPSTAGTKAALAAGLFWNTVYVIVSGIMPMRGMESLREESVQGNAEMLLLGGMSRWQIVRGKWLVQGVLTLLTLLSLAPYMLARYFFGGIELWQDFFTLLSVLATALGISGCVLGASGYPGLGKRFAVVIFCAAVLLAAAVATGIMISMARGEARIVDLLKFAYGFSYTMLLNVLYAIMGMQLGRAHLKLYLLPFEISPTRSVMLLMFAMPFILIAGAIASCGGGAILVLALLVYIMAIYDRPIPPPRRSGAQPPSPMAGYPRF